MKKLHIIFIFLILNINVVNANDKIDCSKYSKFTKKYLICTINQLKKTTKEKTSKITKTAKEKTNGKKNEKNTNTFNVNDIFKCLFVNKWNG